MAKKLLEIMRDKIRLNERNGEQNNKDIKTAFELLSRILDDTARTDKDLIGFRPYDN